MVKFKVFRYKGFGRLFFVYVLFLLFFRLVMSVRFKWDMFLKFEVLESSFFRLGK